MPLLEALAGYPHTATITGECPHFDVYPSARSRWALHLFCDSARIWLSALLSASAVVTVNVDVSASMRLSHPGCPLLAKWKLDYGDGRWHPPSCVGCVNARRRLK